MNKNNNIDEKKLKEVLGNIDSQCMLNVMSTATEKDPQYKKINETFGPYAETLFVKGCLLADSGEYIKAITYYQMALYMLAYRYESSKDDKMATKVLHAYEMVKSSTAQAEQKYRQQLEDGGKDGKKEVDLKPLDGTQMTNNLTGKQWSFKDMSGASKEKQELNLKFIMPTIFPQLFLADKTNVLLYGPSGTGKTVLVKAAVNQLNNDDNNVNKADKVVYLFFAPQTDSIRSKWEGGTEKNITAIFKQASEQAYAKEEESVKATGKKSKYMSILFLDEVEAIAGKRTEKGGDERAVTTLLQQMDGVNSPKNVILIAATNMPWKLDFAFVRRFGSKILVDFPDIEAIVDALWSTVFSKFSKHCNLAKLLTLRYVEDFSQRVSGETSTISKSVQKLLEDIKTFDPYTEGKDGSYIPLKPSKADGKNEGKNNNFGGISNGLYQSTKRFMEKAYVVATGTVCDTDNKSKQPVTVTEKQFLEKQFLEKQMKHYIEINRFFHYLAYQMGPSKKLYDTKAMKELIGFVKTSSTFAISNHGYSMSDISNVISEYFSSLAGQILSRKVEQSTKSECKSPTDLGLYTNADCFVTTEDGKQLVNTNSPTVFYSTPELRGADKKYKRVYDNKKASDWVDVFCVIDPILFQQALQRYPSTEGFNKLHCSYYVYERTGSYADRSDMCGGGGSTETSDEKKVEKENKPLSLSIPASTKNRIKAGERSPGTFSGNSSESDNEM